MFSGRLTLASLQALDWLAGRKRRRREAEPPVWRDHPGQDSPREDEPPGDPPHQRIGRRGEEAAYFYLRRRGYVMIARNYRSPHHHGELDLVGWDRDVLCFIEVKTRTSRSVKPAGAAVDLHKQKELARVARDFLRQMPCSCPWRFDVLAVYLKDPRREQPTFELFQNAFSVAYN